MFYYGLKLWEAHLSVCYVSGRLAGGTMSRGSMRLSGSAKERPSRAWGRGRGRGERFDPQSRGATPNHAARPPVTRRDPQSRSTTPSHAARPPVTRRDSQSRGTTPSHGRGGRGRGRGREW